MVEEHECHDSECGCESGGYEATEIVLDNKGIDELIKQLVELKENKIPAEIILDDKSGLIFTHADSMEEEEEEDGD